MTNKVTTVISERTRLCLYCGSKITASALSYEENPYCSECLPQRLKEAARGTDHISWKLTGNFLHPVNLSRQKRQ